MQIKLHIHGNLKAFMPSLMLINVDTAQQAVSFILRTFKGVRQAIKRGMYRFSLTSNTHSSLLSEDSRFDRVLPSHVTEIHLVPIEGVYAKRFIGIIAGIALIGIGVALTLTGVGGAIGVNLIGLGVGVLVGGIAQLLTPIPKVGDLEQGDTPENRQSTLFTGVTNRLARGVGLPVCYGTFYCGSNVVSQSILTEEVL